MFWTAAVLALIVVGALAGHWLRKRLADRIDEVTAETVAGALFTALVAAGAAAIVWIWEVVAEVETILAGFEPDALFGVRVLVSLLLVAVAYLLTRLAARIVKRTRRQGSRDHRREVAYHVVQVSVYAITSLVVLGLWRINLANLLVGAGFLGIVLGLAARQTLGAVIAGFVLLFSRPFEVGDWVAIGDREGIVRDVSVVNTQIQTFDDEHVLIPNDQVTGTDIVNKSREGKLRVTQEVGVDYDADVDQAVTIATEAIEEVDLALSNPSPRVVAKRFDDSAVVLELRFWIGNPSAERLWQARTDATRQVKSAFEREGVSIPFPQRSLSARGEQEPVAFGTTEAASGRIDDGEDAAEGEEGAVDADDEGTTTDDESGKVSTDDEGAATADESGTSTDDEGAATADDGDERA